MKLLDVVREVRRHLEENGRVSLRMLRRQYDLDDEALGELIEELVDVQRVARREENVLVWSAAAAPPTVVQASGSARPAGQPVAPSAGARKVVTILFADLAGSTGLHERLDPESVNAFMENYYRAMRGAVEAHRGTVVKLLGDGVMAAFGVPRVAEDDAMRAVRAGVEMQQAFRQLAGEHSARVGGIGLRVALNTGEVVVNTDNTDVVGDPVNVAARLQQEARNGDVVLGESTHRLVAALVTLAPLGSVALKGRAEAVKVYRVESLQRPVGTATAAFVGRDDELGRITAVYDAAIATPAARLAVLLGSPGLGKSRLIEEFTGRLDAAATMLTAQCDAEGGATFAPLAEALREVLSINRDQVPLLTSLTREGSGEVGQLATPPPSPLLGKEGDESTSLRAALEAAVPAADTERPRIVAGISALLAGSPASPEETFFVIRRFLAALATVKPVVLVIDDLHWAEPLLLDLVEHLVQWGNGVRLLVLVGARPELRDVRSSLVTPGGLVADVLTLSGLDAGAAMRLAANVIGAADLPAAVAAKVLATSEGNPLFVGELVRMLVQEGALTKDGDRWIPGVALAALEMPPTIHALLAARIERLRPEERSVLERAAVVGRHFSRSAVAELLPREVVDLDARLEALRRSELIERDSGWFLGEPVLRFHHILIRDAAYRRLLKGTRAELHARFADWVTARAGDAADHDETIGWHLEQAHQLLRELGPLDAVGRVLGERAAQHLAAAGRRALARDDLPVAANLLGRAIECMNGDDTIGASLPPEASARRADLALDWCEALLAAGDVGPAAKAIDELGRFIGATAADQILAPSPTHPLSVGEGRGEGTSGGDTLAAPASGSLTLPSPALNRRAGEASVRLRAWHTCFRGQLTVLTAPQGLQAAADAVAGAAEELAQLGDAAGEAKAHSVHAQALARLGKVGACEAALDHALAAARRAGDRRRANAVLAGAPLAALWGPSPVTRASGRCLDVVRVLRITQGAPAVESVALSCQGVLEALRGRTEAAGRMLASSRKMVEDLGIAHRLFEADTFSGRIAAMEGDAAGAERLLCSAYEGLRDLGLGIDAARAGALLARTLLAQDRVAEAESLSHESERLAGDDLQAAIAWRGVRAEALAKRGEHAAAVELAKAAVAIASATDALLDHADARMALAAALRAAGRSADANAEERRAIELWEAKGATLPAERARRESRPLAPVTAGRAVRAEPPQILRRRIRANAALRCIERHHAGIVARDVEALMRPLSAHLEVIYHPTGTTYGAPGIAESWRAIFEGAETAAGMELEATLGESLALARLSLVSTGSFDGDVGPVEAENLLLVVVDAQGLAIGFEFFGADRLGEAITRLYERYSELLPDGPERARAAATARSFGVMLTSTLDIDRYATVIAPGFESVDHRHLSAWSMRGGGAFLDHLRALQEVATDVVIDTRDVLALAPGAVLIQRMHSGTERLGGGAYERPFLVLFATDAEGRLARAEWFDADREAAALARFEALVGAEAPRPVRRRVRANAATRQVEREWAAVEARDLDALTALNSGLEVVHHPTGTTYGAPEVLVMYRGLWRGKNIKVAQDVLATLGDSLALGRRSYSHEGIDAKFGTVGPVEGEVVGVFEFDECSQVKRSEIFAADHLGEAVARLYARYAELLPEGPERARGAATARSVAVVAPGGFDRARYAEVFRSDVEIVDHKLLGFGTEVGVNRLFRSMAAGREVGDQVVSRPQDVLALTHDTLLLRWLTSGVGRESGGAFEWAFLRLFVFDADGRVARYELFDADREAEALARFEEVAKPNPLAPFPTREGGRDSLTSLPVSGRDRVRGSLPEPFANAASRTDSELFRCFNARDWEGVLACVAPVMVFDERRRLLRNTCDRDVWLEQFRFVFDVPNSRFTSHLRATRGERLALNVHRFEGEVAEGGGPLAVEDHLALHEVDGDGHIVGLVLFDLEDEDAAYAELDARYEAGEAATPSNNWLSVAGFVRAVARRDWDAVRALCRDDFVEQDHRGLAVLGGTEGADAWVDNFRTLVELAPDTVYRAHHVLEAERGYFVHGSWYGTREGGRYELQVNAVLELDAAGRFRRADMYDDAVAAAAFARLAELEGPPAPQRFANAATRAVDRGTAALAARDWEGFARLFAPGARHFDRSRMAQIESDAQEWVASFRQIVEMTSAPPVRRLLATRGERLALFRMLWQGAAGDIGLSEIDWLLIIEVNECGEHAAVVVYDPEDIDAAYAELEARWAGGGAATHPVASKWLADYLRYFAARDWNAMASMFAPDLMGENHRLVGWGTRQGPEGVVSTLRAQIALAPDTRERVDHVRTCDGAVLFEYAWHGTREGGAFENLWLVLVELAPDGRACRADVWEPEQLDRAWARFAEIGANPPADPIDAFLKGHPVTTALESWAVFDTGADPDWEALHASCAPDMTFEDRQGFARLSGDREMMIASLRERVASGARAERRLLGTAGERIAVMRMLWTGGPDDGRFEIEYVSLAQLDEAGLVDAIILFGPDDERAAQREAWARWAAIDPVAAPWVELMNEFTEAWNGHDRARVRSCFVDDFVLEDHRHAGLGRIEGAEAYLDSIVVLWELAPDQRIMVGWSWLVVERHGTVVTVRRQGTVPDGGPFESEHLALALARNGRFTRIEFFEIDALDAALARLADRSPARGQENE